MNYLYGGDYNWATSCLGILNVKDDIDELNCFIMDCIRACETGKKKIGGLGYEEKEKSVITRGRGRNVSANRNKTEREIINYLSVGCLSNAYKIGKPVYNALIKSIV